MDALDVILNKNTFQFDNRHYIQVIGAVMGTKAAPSYSTLTLAFSEEKLYNTMENKYGQSYTERIQIIREEISR